MLPSKWPLRLWDRKSKFYTIHPPREGRGFQRRILRKHQPELSKDHMLSVSLRVLTSCTFLVQGRWLWLKYHDWVSLACHLKLSVHRNVPFTKNEKILNSSPGPHFPPPPPSSSDTRKCGSVTSEVINSCPEVLGYICAYKPSAGMKF